MSPQGMRPSAPRTVQDIRALRSMQVRAGPGNEPGAYAMLSQLARERQHLLAEQELWQRKLRRISSRLAEVESQMQRLRRETPETHGEGRARSPGRAYQEMEFRY